jgi:cytochrome P450
VFGYDDVRALFADQRLSSDRMKGLPDAAPASMRDEIRSIAPFLETWILMEDGEPHARMRGFLHRGFNAAAIAAMRPAIEAAADELLERGLRDGRLDVAADYAFLLPAYVLSDFMGVHPADRDRIVQWSVDFIDFFNIIPITEDTSRRMVASARAMAEHARGLLAERRAQPRDDFLGVMARAAEEAGGPSEDEIVGNAMLILLAGHVAVRNLIGNVVWLLLTHPEEHDRLRTAPELLDSAIEETLRCEPPVALIPRIAREEIELRGQRIPAGALVQLSIAAANRDPTHFPDPDRFDVARDPKGVLSFGHGPHGCLGARLAHLQAHIALERLFARVPEMRLDADREIVWYRNAANRGPERLPLLVG